MPRGKNETQSWAVTVERNGESVVTLSSNMLAGRDLSDEDERVIRMAAEHLLAFIGTAPAQAVSERPKRQCVIGEYCSDHRFIHGAEAEELRERIGTLVNTTRGSGSLRADIRALLDDVDARDSVAFLEVRRLWTEPNGTPPDFAVGKPSSDTAGASIRAPESSSSSSPDPSN